MKTHFAQWSLILLCFSMAAAIGGGLYEHIVLTPLWRKSPPASFAILQPGTGVPLQRFWIPVHAAITLFVVLALVLTWRDPSVRRLLLIGLGSYFVMRVWSGLYFIPEMLAFQKIPPDAAPSVGLNARVSEMDLLVLVQGTSRCCGVSVLSAGPLRSERIKGRVEPRRRRPERRDRRDRGTSCTGETLRATQGHDIGGGLTPSNRRRVHALSA